MNPRLPSRSPRPRWALAAVALALTGCVTPTRTPCPPATFQAALVAAAAAPNDDAAAAPIEAPRRRGRCSSAGD